MSTRYLRNPGPLLASDQLLHIDRVVVVFAFFVTFCQHLLDEIVDGDLRIHQFARVLMHGLHHLLALVGLRGRVERIMFVPGGGENGFVQFSE